MSRRLRGYSLVGCLPYHQSLPSFALPIFAREGVTSALYVQEIDEISRQIANFKRIENVGVQDLISLKDVYETSDGGEQIYVFLTENAEIVGRIIDISHNLREFCKLNNNEKDIILQIMELIGDNNEKKAARTEARNWVRSHADESAAHVFHDVGLLDSIFWELLLARSPNHAVSRRILSMRGNLTARLSGGENIEFDISALPLEDQAAFNLEEICDEILRQFGSERVQYTLDLRSAETPFVSGSAPELLSVIRSAGRQEERIALLLKLILENRELGLNILKLYINPKAMTERWAISHLVHSVFSNYNANKALDQLLIADFIPVLFRHHYPLARGELLYYLAKHLRCWPDINRSIKEVLNRTRSVFVHNFAKSISQLLDVEALPPESEGFRSGAIG